MAATRPEEENTFQAALMDEVQKLAFPAPPTFSTKIEEREYLKFRLAQAFRIFGTHTFLHMWQINSSPIIICR